MTQYQIELMAVIKFGNPSLSIEELEREALLLFQKIKDALDYNRESNAKKA